MKNPHPYGWRPLARLDFLAAEWLHYFHVSSLKLSPEIVLL